MERPEDPTKTVLGALGTLFYGNMSQYSGDLDDITKNCCCRITPDATNNPLPNLGQFSQYGFFICFCNYAAGNRTMYQVVGNYTLSVGDLYLRGGREGPTWSTWKKVTLSAV